MSQISAGNKLFSARKPTILVADDDEDLLQLLKLKMKAEGFVVQISPNGERIFDMVETARPDIIMLDIAMKGVNGGDICKLLKTNNKTKDIPIVMFSANQNIETIARECGADDCIVKPFNSDLVKEKLFEVLERKLA